ncbi:hypothetical protein [Shimia aestuarii]|nr:hypothetical protein [Shimia aestuarii]
MMLCIMHAPDPPPWAGAFRTHPGSGAWGAKLLQLRVAFRLHEKLWIANPQTRIEMDAHFKITETRDHEIVIFEEQYRSLRREILERQQRRFWIVAGGALGLPGLSGLKVADLFLLEFIYAMPFLIIAMSLLFIVEVNGIARAGRFIEEKIENAFRNVSGWEHFLKDGGADKGEQIPAVRLANASFIVLMLIYYLLSAALATFKLAETFNNVVGLLYASLMFVVFVWWIFEIVPFLGYSAESQKKGPR